MPQSKKSPFTSLIRVTILSAILASLLIYLGINYHWGDYLKPTPKPSTVLLLPEKTDVEKTDVDNSETITQTSETKNPTYNPEIINTNNENPLLDSMNKEQITEHCTNLLSTEIKEPITLELATVNCVMSNYQETFQNSKTVDNDVKRVQHKRLSLKNQCAREYIQSPNHSLIHRELLIGICVSDRLNTTQ